MLGGDARSKASYRREAAESAGRFRLGYGCDETESCIRLSVLRPESELLYVPEATVRHHVPASRGTLRDFVTRCWCEGGSKAVVSAPRRLGALA